MTGRLLLSLSKLEKRTEHLFDELCSWTPEQLQFRPSLVSWSALDLIDHLVLTERAVLATMRSNLSAGYEVTFRDRYRSAIVLGMMALPVRLKVPRSVEYLLPAQTQPDLQLFRSSWVHDRSLLTEFVQSLSRADRKQGIFRHPFGGWTTASGALLFLHLHLYHHLYQFRRLQETRQRTRGRYGKGPSIVGQA